MSQIILSPNASGTGQFTIQSPNSNTNRTLTLPDATGTINTSGAVNEVPAGSASAPAIYSTGDTNTGIFFPAADTIAFSEGGAEAMRIDSSGNVGIGTSSPTLAKTVINGTYNGIHLALTTASNGTLGALMDANGGFIGTLSGATVDALRLGTTGTERMRITSGGDVLVGTTDAGGSSGAGFKLTNSGQVMYMVTAASTAGTNNYHYYSTGAGAFRFYVGAEGKVYCTNTTISAISDQRLKENIQDIDVGLNAVLALKPRKFDWKKGKGKGIKGDRGWIAQEFEQVFPDMVSTWLDEPPEGEEPYKSVGADLIPVLVKAIQELKAELDEAKARIATLEAK